MVDPQGSWSSGASSCSARPPSSLESVPPRSAANGSAANGASTHAPRDRDLAVAAASLYRARQRRMQHFDSQLFSEPAWDMLLELFIKKMRGNPVSTIELCAAARVPAATGLRWIARLEEHGLLRRYQSSEDRRFAWVELTLRANRRMRKYVSGEMARLSSAERFSDQAGSMTNGALPNDSQRTAIQSTRPTGSTYGQEGAGRRGNGRQPIRSKSQIDA